MNLTLYALVCAALLAIVGLPRSYSIWFLVLFVFQAGFFMLGILYTREKMENLRAVVLAPGFLAWKMGIDLLSVLGKGRGKWVPTKRIVEK
jgi:hypothetical protein